MNGILANLSAKRPVFHSEADFQHALARELQLINSAASIRMGKQVATQGARVHLDLLFQSPSEDIAIELKFKTKILKFSHAGEDYSLRDHRAQDFGRHDFIKDIQRLERYVQSHKGSEGFAILLTNDQAYWSESRKADSLDSEFRIHEGRILQGSVAWGSGASDATKHKRADPITLRGIYQMYWSDYSSLGSGLGEQFRHVLVHIPEEP